MNQLAADGVSMRLGGRLVLNNISCAFAPGTVTAIVGPNGAGKSTLLSCLAGLRRPDDGTVRLAGSDLLARSPRERARRIGFLPQVPEIAWPVEVEVLVGLGRIPRAGPWGPSAADRQSITRALAVTALLDMRHRHVTTLSGGERARVLLARVLAGEPEWLLADEPLAGLDPGHQLDTLALLRAFASAPGHGVILSLHDLPFAARIADRIIVLAEGSVLADGGAREALAPDVLARAYGVEARWAQGSSGPILELVRRLAP